MATNGSFYWNELMTRDAEAAKKFYGATLGWTFEAMEQEGGGEPGYWLAKVGRNVELFRATLDGKTTQLSDSPAGTLHYHPGPSPDGKWLKYGSKRDGVRNLYVMHLEDRKERRHAALGILESLQDCLGDPNDLALAPAAPFLQDQRSRKISRSPCRA